MARTSQDIQYELEMAKRALSDNDNPTNRAKISELENEYRSVDSGQVSKDRVAELERLAAQEGKFAEDQRTRVGQSLDIGKKLGNEFLPDGSLGSLSSNLGKMNPNGLGVDSQLSQVDSQLGRINPNLITSGVSGDISDVLKRRREALAGYSNAEQVAARENGTNQLNRATESSRRQIANIQSNTGVRGGAASAQQAQALYQGVEARANFERQLFLDNENAKRDALNAYETSATQSERDQFARQAAQVDLYKTNLGQESNERKLSQFNLDQQFRERQIQQSNNQSQINAEKFNLDQEIESRRIDQFNLEQRAKERFGQLGTSLGVAQLVEGGVSTDKAIEAQKAAAAAAGGGGGTMSCLYLYNQGLMSDNIFMHDQVFGNYMQQFQPITYIGYAAIAVYLVSLMKRSILITKIIAKLFDPGLKFIAGENNQIGKCLLIVGAKTCYYIGKFKMCVNKKRLI